MNGFLPKEYKIPESSGKYTRLEDGKNKLRILGSFENGTAIMGTEYWVTVDGARKPKRLKPGVPVPVEELELNPKTGDLEDPKHFWILPVYNYTAKAVQLWEITQKSIMRAIKDYAQNEDWGSPLEYDLTVSRQGEGLKTEYSVMPSPKKPLDEAILAEYKALNINIKVLYEGGDPFAQTNEQVKEFTKFEESDEDFLNELDKAVA